MIPAAKLFWYSAGLLWALVTFKAGRHVGNAHHDLKEEIS